jgi:ankyrin repeat protein
MLDDEVARRVDEGLLEACIKGDIAATSSLLDAGACVNALCAPSVGCHTTPLLEAVKNAGCNADHTVVVKQLLQAGADPDRVPGPSPSGEPPGDSALQHAAAEGYLVRRAISHSNAPAIHYNTLFMSSCRNRRKLQIFC